MAREYKHTMERDILEAVYEFGEIRPDTQASRVLADKYPLEPGDNSPRVQVTVMLNYLLEERFLNLEGNASQPICQVCFPLYFWISYQEYGEV